MALILETMERQSIPMVEQVALTRMGLYINRFVLHAVLVIFQQHREFIILGLRRFYQHLVGAVCVTWELSNSNLTSRELSTMLHLPEIRPCVGHHTMLVSQEALLHNMNGILEMARVLPLRRTPHMLMRTVGLIP